MKNQILSLLPFLFFLAVAVCAIVYLIKVKWPVDKEIKTNRSKDFKKYVIQ